MCLAVPAQIRKLDGDTAFVEIKGNFRNVNISLIEDPHVGEYVLLHAGFAIERVEPSVADELNDLEGIG